MGVMKMTWDVFNIMGIAAFAISGAIVAMEEKYDILGALVLGFVTAFGGGIIRNLLIGLPVHMLWKQEALITTALIAILLAYVSPDRWINNYKKWIDFFDAIGLSAFSIQGALYAVQAHHPLIAVIAATVLTGIGGGIIRDVLAGRKPLVFRGEIYAIWAMVIGLLIGLKVVHQGWELYALFVAIVVLRTMSFYFGWHLPLRVLAEDKSQTTNIPAKG